MKLFPIGTNRFLFLNNLKRNKKEKKFSKFIVKRKRKNRRNFAGYTLYLSEDVVEHFFDDYDNDKGDLEEAKRCAIIVQQKYLCSPGGKGMVGMRVG